MFLDFHGLREQPFGVTPDPRFLFQTRTHREALASLQYGIQSSRGFIALVAEPGLGKTTLLFELLQRLGNTARTAFLFQTQSNSRELMGHLLTDLEIDAADRDPVRMHEKMKALLVRESRTGRRVVIVIDEAQNLEPEVLETVRLLSNFETPGAKLLQIILSGQPRLYDKLSDPALAQVRQRIGMTSRLQPLAAAEVTAYVEHRLRVAGHQGGELFSADAMHEIAEATGGVPRNINNICFNALSLAFALNSKRVDRAMIAEVASDFDLALALSRRDLMGRFDSFVPQATNAPGTQPLPSIIEARPARIGGGAAIETAVAAATTTTAETSAVRAACHTASAAAAAAPAPKIAPDVALGTTAATIPPRRAPLATGRRIALQSWKSVAAGAIAVACVALGTGMLLARRSASTRHTVPNVAAPQVTLTRAANEAPVSNSASVQSHTAPSEAMRDVKEVTAASVQPMTAQFLKSVATDNAGEHVAVRKQRHTTPAAANDMKDSAPDSLVSLSKNGSPLPGSVIAVVERDHTSGDVTISHFFNLDPMLYPATAREQQLQGEVVLRGTINKAGAFSQVRALSGDHQLVVAAIRALEKHRFDSGRNRRGHGVWTELTLEFKLPANLAKTAQAGGGK